MGYRFLIIAVLVSLVSACAAFDSDESTGGLKNPDGSIAAVPDVKFEGIYKGDKKLTKNSCLNMKDEVETSAPITLDVLQSAAVISVMFEDKEVVDGNMKDNKVELMKKADDKSSIISLQFKDKNITGTEDYFEGAELNTPCATYELKLSRVEDKSKQEAEKK
ncbi:MAG: hypothetical protein ABIE74_01780 [Pseudomonadota bacterium]